MYWCCWKLFLKRFKYPESICIEKIDTFDTTFTSYFSNQPSFWSQLQYTSVKFRDCIWHNCNAIVLTKPVHRQTDVNNWQSTQYCSSLQGQILLWWHTFANTLLWLMIDHKQIHQILWWWRIKHSIMKVIPWLIMQCVSPHCYVASAWLIHVW